MQLQLSLEFLAVSSPIYLNLHSFLPQRLCGTNPGSQRFSVWCRLWISEPWVGGEHRGQQCPLGPPTKGIRAQARGDAVWWVGGMFWVLTD